MKPVVIGDKIEINAELLREFYEKSDHRSEIVQVINIQEELVNGEAVKVLWLGKLR